MYPAKPYRSPDTICALHRGSSDGRKGRQNQVVRDIGVELVRIAFDEPHLELLASRTHLEVDVVEAAVIGVPSERWGETPVGFITLKESARDCDTIRDAVNSRLGKTQRLAQLHVIDEMPRSHIGKLLKTELREEAVRRGLPA